MNKTFRKVLVAAAALIAVVIVPVSTATSDHAGGFGEYPYAKHLTK
ncbi:hypothetical protein [Micropruina sp.]